MPETLPLNEPPQTRWQRRKGRGHMCSRDPSMGPGTCYSWWDGCPQPRKSNCFALWTRNMIAAGYPRPIEVGPDFCVAGTLDA